MCENVINMKLLNKRTDLGVYLTLLTVCSGIWFFLYTEVTSITSNDIYNDIVLSLVFSHAVVTVTILGLLVIVFNLKDFNKSRKIKKIVRCINVLTLPILYYCSINYVVFKVGLNITYEYKLMVNNLISLAIVFLLYWGIYRFTIRQLFDRFNFEICFVLGLIAWAYFLFLPIMTIIASDVTVSFDKSIYYDEDVVYKVERKGYVFLPNVTSVVLNGEKEILTVNVCNVLKKELLINSSDYIEIQYRWSLLKGTTFSVYKYIPFVSKESNESL